MPLESEAVGIRLFVLLPGQDNDPIVGRIIHSNIDWRVKHVKYEALSYVWGDPHNFSSVSISGCYLPVMPNLVLALRRLRTKDCERILWIDSICINQHDIHERNSQVRIMQCIYERAENVNIWLGPDTENSSIGMAILRYLAPPNDEGEPHWKIKPLPDTQPPWATLPPELVLAGLKDIMGRPWFQRVWVVQEAVVSQRATMICGQDEFSWPSKVSTQVERFIRMIKFAGISPQWKHVGLDAIDMSPILKILDLQVGQQFDRAYGFTTRRAPDLLDMVYDLRHKLSSDPRDKIFALAGLPATAVFEEFECDYEMTLEDVYKKLREKI